MADNKTLIRRLTEAKDYFDKENDHILYRDPATGKLKVDYSKLRKRDDRNFVALTKKILNGTSLLNKAEDISGIEYNVYIKGGPNINKFDIENAKKRLGNRGIITDNLLHSNRDRTIVTIKFNKK